MSPTIYAIVQIEWMTEVSQEPPQYLSQYQSDQADMQKLLDHMVGNDDDELVIVRPHLHSRVPKKKASASLRRPIVGDDPNLT